MSSLFPASPRTRAAALRSIPGAVLAAFAAVLASAAFAADKPLTLDAALQRAVERSRVLAAKDYSITASREMAIAAGQLPDPVLKLGIDNLPVDGPDRFSVTRDFMTQRRVGLMQDLPGAGKRQLRAQRFEREAEKSAAEKTLATATVQRDTALAWLDSHYAQAMAAAIAEQVGQAKLEVDAAEGAYRAGRGSQAEIFNARTELLSLEDRASEANRRAGNATTILARWIGDAAVLPLGPKPALDSIGFDAAMLEAQLAHHPAIAVLSKQVDIANTEAKLAQANRKADWSVELAFQQRGPGYSNMVSLGVSIPLQWHRKNRQDRELSSSLAMVEQAKAEREDAVRAHIAEVRSMIEEWHNKRERHERYEQELVPLASSRTEATMAAYRGGKAALAHVLSSRRGEIDARLQALQLAADTDRLWAQLNFLMPADSAPAKSIVWPNKDAK